MSIYDKKYQIFVSSTYSDLIEARNEVIKVILSIYQIPIGMEMFSADNDEQWAIIESTIKTSDYYLLVIGHRYGSLTKEDISYTEKEFNYAKSLGIPVLSFVKNRNIATTPQERDNDPNKTQLLDAFLKKVLDNSMCDFWSNESELGQKTAIALTKLFFKTPRIGWVRASNVNPIETTEELTKLSHENRELREELLRLKTKNSNEMPKIEVKINDSALSLEYKNPRFIEFLPVSKDQFTVDQLTQISDEEISYFNQELEIKSKEIEKYKNDFARYENIKNNNSEIFIEISNVGQIKATDIFVDITFPTEILLGEKSDMLAQKPIKPKIPESPRTKVLKLSLFDNNRWQELSYNEDILALRSLTPLRLPNMHRDFFVDDKTNTLKIRLDKLIHTRTRTIKDDIMIAPLKKGTFEIILNIMCNEYSNSETIKVPIVIK
jgi:hypothetical protein